VALSDGTAEVMLLTREGRAIRFPETEISIMGRTAQGVKGIDLRGEDRVVGVLLVRRAASLLTVTEDGKGKRTELDEFPVQKRGGLGNLVTSSGDEAPDLVAALEVLQGDEVMVVAASGKVHRIQADGTPVQGRRTQGKRLVRVEGDDRVVEVTRAYRSREENPMTGVEGGSRSGGSGSDDGAGDGPDDGSGAEGENPPASDTAAEAATSTSGGDEDQAQFDLLGED